MKSMLVVTVGLVALLAACGSTTPAGPASTPSASAPVAAPALDGTSWNVAQLNGSAPLSGHEPTMEFAKGSVAGLASCNRYTATYTQTDSAVTITPGILTQMACADDVMTQEQAFTKALTQVAGARTAGEGVELVDASGKAVLTLAKVADLPLEGTDWTLSGIVSSSAISSPVADSTVTLKIADGKLSGTACNTFRGDVTASDGSFKAGPLMSTKMACKSDELTTQETTVLKALQAATTYSIKGSDLTISAADGTGLVFTGKQ